MAMDGETLGVTIGNALYANIPQSVLNEMSATAKAEMCAALQNSWKTAAACIINHISTLGVVTIQPGIPVGPSPSSVVGATLSPGTGSIS